MDGSHLSIIHEMFGTNHKAIAGYRQCGDPVPHLEWVMHPSSFMDLGKAASSDQSGLGRLLQRRIDGVWEFMHHAIREDVDQRGWKLQPTTQQERG